MTMTTNASAFTVTIRTPITGHTSPETAYLVADYPYGFRLRCQIRYWIEHNPRHGFRFMSQTTNPKKPGTVWNKPKSTTYYAVLVMVLDNDERVTYAALNTWTDDERIDAFAAQHAAALTDAHRQAIRFLRALNATGRHVTFTVEANGDEPRQSPAEQDAVWRAALARGYAETA